MWLQGLFQFLLLLVLITCTLSVQCAELVIDSVLCKLKEQHLKAVHLLMLNL